MKDIVQPPTGYFDSSSCDIAEFDRLCSSTLPAEAVPQAAEVTQNIPIYDGAALRGRMAEAEARQALMAEWARNLMGGSGVIVIKGGYAETEVLDAATAAFTRLIEAERATHVGADHFAAGGANDRLWNSLQKLCLADPALFARYHGNVLIDAVCEAWLGPNYQMSAQVNLVHPGGKAQTAHRDYHLGFQTEADCARYPAHVHALSPVLTLQAGIAHCDMPVASGPTKLLPFSQQYLPGYAAYRLAEFSAYFEEHYVQLPLAKGDLLFFNPAVFHAAGENKTADVSRFVNLLQVSSAMGRAMETIDRRAMSTALYPVLAENAAGQSAAERAAVVAASAEGYPFPTNLDTDPPVGGLAPPSMARLMHAALEAGDPLSAYEAALEAQAQRQRA